MLNSDTLSSSRPDDLATAALTHPPQGSSDLFSSRFEPIVRNSGATHVAWLTRLHQELSEAFPDQTVVRLRESAEELTLWLKDQGHAFSRRNLTESVGFDPDRGAARFWEEGGWLEFSWDGHRFGYVGIRIWSARRDETYGWLVAPNRNVAETFVQTFGEQSRKASSRVLSFDDGDWEPSPRVEKEVEGHSWDSVILPEQDKSRLRKVVEVFFASKTLYAELGIPWKLGILLYGPPGTGKTITTKVLAATCDARFLYVRGLGSFYNSNPDAGSIREMFQGARDRAPCILCLEDVDSMITDDLRTVFLNELDGMEQDFEGVLTVATTNYPEKLDPAILFRPSRFDYRFEFHLPDDATRRAFVAHWTDRLASLGYLCDAGTAVEEIVARSRGLSQAYLKRVLVGAITRMHTEGQTGDDAFRRLVAEELEDANRVKRVKPVTTNGLNGSPTFGFFTE